MCDCLSVDETNSNEKSLPKWDCMAFLFPGRQEFNNIIDPQLIFPNNVLKWVSERATDRNEDHSYIHTSSQQNLMR